MSLLESHKIKDVFYEWLNDKLEYGEIQKQTYDRYETDFIRFFKGSNLVRKEMQNITEYDLEYFIKTEIKEKNLSNKAYGGLRLILLGVFKYAKKKKYTDISITHFFGDLDISRKSFKKVSKTDEESVFTDLEVEMIEKYISQDESLLNLGVLLAFQTGLRAGEISALKPSDISGNILSVNKTEIWYKKNDGTYSYEVRDSAKTDAGNRNVVLGSNAIKTLKKIRSINPFGEYLFMRGGKRISGKSFTEKLYRICESLDITKRSLHKARKTYATKLLNGNVDEKIVIRQLGHTDISCTKNFYYFNNKDVDQMREQIERAISY